MEPPFTGVVVALAVGFLAGWLFRSQAQAGSDRTTRADGTHEHHTHIELNTYLEAGGSLGGDDDGEEWKRGERPKWDAADEE